MKQLSAVCIIGLALFLEGCSFRTPSSSFDGTYSTTTALHMLPGFGAGTYKGYPDDQVIHFQPARSDCPIGRVRPPRKAERPPGAPPIMPGIVVLNDTLGIDEAEIPNQEWQQFQMRQTQAGANLVDFQPQTAALPVADYYYNPFYRYYPVTGISREQAEAFCRWRSRVVQRAVNEQHPDSLGPDFIRCVYRLPSEAEWELAAATLSITCANLPVHVAPGAAQYLKKRSGSSQPESLIRNDITAYNATRPVRSVICYAQAEPYFLRLATPAYVYQGPATRLYHLLGNVAELVQEPGITKGGSYLDPLDACTVKARGTYNGPAPTVGFRCVCEVSYPNRK